MATEKQIKANRQNATKGGVKTKTGKETSKMNALKFGLCSNAILISGNYQEDPKELEEFKNQLYQDLCPIGAIEELLVQRIVFGYWRLERLLRTEKGLVQQCTNSYLTEKALERINIANDIYDKIPTKLESYKNSNPKAIERTIELFNFAKEQLLGIGYLSTMNQKRLSDYFYRSLNHIVEEEIGEANSFLNPFDEEVYHNEANEEKKKEMRQIILNDIEEEIRVLKICLKDIEEKTENEDEANVYSALIPNELELDRLQRYEISISNQIDKALQELQRLQLIRKATKGKL